MLQASIESELARASGYPPFLSAEHIALVLKRDSEKKLLNTQKEEKL